jgi:hypothetical protein
MGRFFRWVRGIRAFERRDRGENPNHGGAQRTQRIDQELLIAEIAEKGCGVRGEDSSSEYTASSKAADESVRPTRATSKAAGEGARTTHASSLTC